MPAELSKSSRRDKADDNMGDPVFETEAYKLLISDIVEAEREGQDILVTLSVAALKDDSCGNTGKRLRGKKVVLKLKIVWIQGNVKEIKTRGSDKVMIIRDSTHEEAEILNFDKVPGGDHPEIRVGAYVGVLGEVLEIDPVRITPSKVMCLAGQPLLESIWDEEVKDLKAFLLGVIKPMR